MYVFDYVQNCPIPENAIGYNYFFMSVLLKSRKKNDNFGNEESTDKRWYVETETLLGIVIVMDDSVTKKPLSTLTIVNSLNNWATDRSVVKLQNQSYCKCIVMNTWNEGMEAIWKA